MTDAPDGVQALAGEIYRACRSPLDAVFLPSKRASDAAKLPLLAAQVERVRPIGWQASPSEALVLVLRTVADQLDGSDEALAGTWSDMASYMVGAEDSRLTPQPEESGTPRYNARLAAVRAELIRPGSDGREKELLSGLWQQMARCLVDLPPQQILPKPPVEGEAPGEVRRADLYAKARQALIGAARVVVLWGESGNGKSYLARQIQRDMYAGQRVAFVGEDAGTPSAFDRDVLAVLRDAGVAPEGWDSVAREQAFIDMLSEHESFDLVILDNVSHPRLVRLLGRSAVKVLVTSRQAIEVDGGASVFVPAYSKDEALAAATAAMPDISKSELVRFCEDVGHRPLVIDLAAKLLAVSDVTLDSLRTSSRLNAPNAVDAIYSLLGTAAFSTPFGEQLSTTVIEVYRSLVTYLHDKEYALAALAAMLWLPRSGSVEHLAALTRDPARGIDELSARAGIAELAQLALIESVPALQMNDLTRAILRALMASRARDAAARFLVRTQVDNLPIEYQQKLLDQSLGGTPLMRLMTSGLDLDTPEAAWASHSATIETTQRVINNLAPGRQIRFFQVAPGEYIVSQGDCEVVTPIKGVEICFVEVSPDSPAIITTAAGVRRELEAPYAWNVYQYSLLANAANRINGMYRDEPDGGSGIELWRSPDDGHDHDLLTVFPRDVAAAHGLRVWSRCGRWFTPEPSDGTSKAPCPRCESARQARQGWSNYESDLGALWFLKDPRCDDWRFLAMIYSALVFTYAERGEAPNDMPALRASA